MLGWKYVLQARKLCLKLEHKVKGLMTDFTILIFHLLVLLFTAYSRNSCDQPIRKLNDTYQRPFLNQQRLRTKRNTEI